MSELSEDDSEYEYEYDEHETETFYVNLDLTSHNGPIRPPRRRLDSVSKSTSSPGVRSSALPTFEAEDNSEDPNDDASEDRIQILELHSRNPIISYENLIFSCYWADMIGTELLFSLPEAQSGHALDIPCLKHGKDFDLIAANSVKVLGRKAKLISSSKSRGDGLPAVSLSTAMLASTSAPGPQQLQGTTPVRGSQKNNQARFLERLANAKQAKGETDAVRTIFSQKRSQNLEDRLRGWARTEQRVAEIRRLSQKALDGDMDALVALEDIYAEFEAGTGSIDGGDNVGPGSLTNVPHESLSDR
ncbi:hypothetical protein Egran_05018 [Elaphomyces granulatus]|uniref:Transcription factor TFIIIC triple barrel domain-containing protein n=1 Tax=Elaphomyces granulatus TaxID=519963 RepID=A0A232LSW5_9EURO|nr:hypothetical protein Egran_05018 [Elaphomyces granulatus]